VALLAVCLAGCAVVGPASIRGSRLAYNEAIVATNDQQLLAMIVHMRYGESAGLLAVSAVTASMRLEANAGGQVGIGPSSNYEGNLVPLSVGASYEENPTISYAPVQGERYMRQLLSPLPIDLAVLLLNALRDAPLGMTLLLDGVNGIRNPAFVRDPSVAPDPRFPRLMELMSELGRDGSILWTQGTDGYVLIFRNQGEELDPRVTEVCGLFGFPPPKPDCGVITVPVALGVGKPPRALVNLETRSLWDLFQIAAASVDVPKPDVESGMAPPLPPAGAPCRSIRVRRAKSPPDGVLTAVKQHDWWYFIEGTDAESKLTFRILQTLMSVLMADAADKTAAPVLTVPVSR